VRDAARASPRRRALLTLGLCALVIVVWWAMRVPAPPPPAVPFGPGDTLSAQVLWVVNGTTIQVALGGGHERVAYLGIEALGPSATEANRHLVQGQRVWLELDAPLRDGEGRLLAYVYVGDLMVNAELVRQGDARVALLSPPGKYQELFLTRQREARDAKRGVWAE
jgi:endonuclease YncB( thermonuclease family)